MNVKDAILSATQNGLDIILHYYPQAAETLTGRNKHFKIRENEKSASAALKLIGDSYIVTDFGGDGKGKNCFTIVQEKERLNTFSDALTFICKTFNIPDTEHSTVAFEPIRSYRDAKEDEIEGAIFYDIKEEFSNNELRTLYAEKIFKKFNDSNNLKHLKDICTTYNFNSLISYTKIKNRKAITVSSTNDYPIFLIDFGDFKKIYQPKAKEKRYRFFYAGTKPSNFICGYKQLNKAYDKLQQDLVSENSEEVETDKPKKRNPKLSHAILCTGGSDALNVAALSSDNYVLWMNSESEKLLPNDFKKITTMVDTFYNLPDIDITGITQGHALALEYLDIKTIWLPPELAYHRDFRGNNCKDVRDYFKHYKLSTFDTLLKTALPYRFWDLEPKFDKDRNFKKFEFTFNNLHAYNFLYRNGFCRFKDKNSKEGYIFTHIDGDVVKEVLAGDLKDYINTFLENRNAETELRNMVFKTAQVKEQSMGNLPIKEIEFKDNDKDYQFMFFQNTTWKIGKHTIEEFKPGVVNRFVWDDEVIKHDVKKVDDFFKVTYDKTLQRYGIEILNTDSLLFKFLINTANMHWRITEQGIKETDANGNEVERYKLTPDEDYENQIHLINRLFTLGYMMHRYKDPDKAWCPYFMENKVMEESTSNGGSGKSLCANIPSYFMKTLNLNGRNPDLLENNHWNENVTEHIDQVHIEDTHQYFKMDELFNIITGNFPVNPKHSKGYFLSYADSPKITISSNYSPKNLDQSSRRRIIFSVLGDYYHHGPNDEFLSSRTPKSEFGKNLFLDFDENDWNLAANLIAQCIKLYLNLPKIDPPMVNVEKRNLIGVMGDAFLDWADIYFSRISGRLNTNTVKEYAFNDFCMITKTKWTAHKFKSAMHAYCKYKDYVFNPSDVLNSENRIIHWIKVDENSSKTRPVEMIHIRTLDYKEFAQPGTEESIEKIATETNDIVRSNNDKLPF